MNGLKPELRAEVQLHRPVGLEQMMETAQMVEERNLVTKVGQWSPGPPKPKSSAYSNQNPPQSFNPTTKPTIPLNITPTRMASPGPFQKNTPSFKRLTDAEVQVKRERGLCYRCDEKFTVGHRCKNKELQVLVVREMEADSVGREALGGDGCVD